MHGCHCRKYTGERRQNHDYQICKIRELGKEPEESNYWKNQKRVNVNEERAQVYYDYLKSTGLVGRMGMVNHEKD